MSSTIRTRSIMTSLALVLLTSCVRSEPAGPGSSRAMKTTLDVCSSGCSFSQLAPALAEAGDGDTIVIGPGTYRGGIAIEHSVAIKGAGIESTIIRGGGPVVTIGVFEAADQPAVTIEGVTITGGLTRSSAASTEGTDGVEGVIALGGGVEIPQGAGRTLGATVTIAHSLITGNRVAPKATTPTGPDCPDGPCPFAQAAGGIDNWGTLTLEDTTVSRNTVGAVPGEPSLTSDAQGGGIMSWLGDLTILDSTITGNAAVATAPNGRFAEGGGILMPEEGSLTLRDSSVTDNRARLDAALPSSVDMLAQPGGIFVSDAAERVEIVGTRIAGNSSTMTNTIGDATAFAGGINVWGVDLLMNDSVIADNHVRAQTLGRSRGDASADGGGAEMVGTIIDSQFTGNSVSARSKAGDAIAAIGGLSLDSGSLVRTTVSGNELFAFSPEGSVSVFGGGLIVGQEPLTLKRAKIEGNVAHASGLQGYVRGAGIFDASTLWDIPGAELTLVSSQVVGNIAQGGTGLSVQGGGIYIDGHHLIQRGRGLLGDNVPDQCFGCA